MARHVETELNYYRDPGDGSAPTPVIVGSNKVTNERPTVPLAVTVTDMTGNEDQYRLDTHGFQLVRHQTSCDASFADEDAIRTNYYAEMEQLYRDVTGATDVFIFGHRVRRGPSHWHSLGEGNAASRGPLHRVHVDQSYDGARLMAEKHLPANVLLAERSRSPGPRRYQIVNIWRPIRTVMKDPLAVADATTVDDDDLVGAAIQYPNGSRAETWAVRPNERHRWYYKSGQRPDEVLFIKCFDSDEAEGVARRAPHCAFRDAEHDEAESRESVEVRAVLLFGEA
ncbi:hypothetical protein F5X68DRAFT_22275 [Plectosphaerella plurivora]|uniref:Methyltransferase n=1 Tax=Plectosphaerella plurivora TaxID=936078 RepID=A0A9P8V853_9PEZI|nr:hypothetical protein F5X68DRAFT_22275 [Plectosphaerella plurivora]